MYRLCIFDLDGTLLNTIGALTYATNLTLDRFSLPHVTPEQIRRIVGDGYRTQMERGMKRSGIMRRLSLCIWNIFQNTA